jgi:hypothetical protein
MRIFSILMLGLMGSAMIPAAAAPDADIHGDWSVSSRFLGNEDTFTCTFRQIEKAIAGACSGGRFDNVPVTGTIAENSIQFSFTYLFADQEYPCHFQGTVEAATEMKGTVTVTGVDGVTGQFTAKKQ